jgi:dihydroorotate dehydrogenase (fumarate)
MQEHEYESVEQLKGSISQRNATDSSAFLRSNYMRVLDSYQPPPGVQW